MCIADRAQYVEFNGRDRVRCRQPVRGRRAQPPALREGVSTMANWGTDRGGRDRSTAELVVGVVRGQIERGQLRPGQQLPPERELAARLGVSRPSVRTGLRTLATMGIVRTRHGSGTYVTDGPPRLDVRPLRMLAALHGFKVEHLEEARR